ncbi:MAG: primosomal protein N' [Ignavibacteria bacterium]
MSDTYVNVALNLPIESLFTYKVPDAQVISIGIGKRVLVDFGKRTITGIITDILNDTHLKKVKPIKIVLDEEPLITMELIEFCKWISEYYLAPQGEVLFSAIPRNINIKSDSYFYLTDNYREKLNVLNSKEEILVDIISTLEKNKNSGLNKNQLESKLRYPDLSILIRKLTGSGIINMQNHYSKPTAKKYNKWISKNYNSDELPSIMADNKIRSQKQTDTLNYLLTTSCIEMPKLMKLTGITSSSLNTLYKKELISIKELRKNREPEEIFSENQKLNILNSEQTECLEQIKKAESENSYKAFLLYGITGSGKTEVYMQAIENVIEKGKTAIVLVPEISLTPQLIHRFKRKFDNKIGIIHSKLSDGEKLDTLDMIKNGTYRIVIGARSAVFAPLKNIGIIIVDEEHDSSYKQENSPKYNGRDAAIYRAKINDAVVVLGSATPSIESFYNAESGRYQLLSLPNRASNISLPEIRIVDLLKKDKDPEQDRKDFFDSIDKVKIKFISKEMIYEIGKRLENKESIILLLNRRGYHAYSECMNCGNVEMCIRCNIALTYHKSIDMMKCHYCGYIKKFIKLCPACGSTLVIPKGAGTERVEEELIKIFPKAVIKRMDSDTLTSKKLYHKILKDFYDQKIDILAGTQIISKGLDFPEVTLVGVINADIGLLNPDFRATEKTFQILTQVSGRSGRSKKTGEVLIQTNHSDFFVFENVRMHDYKTFYENEIKSRRALNYPPFSRITIIETRSEDAKLAESKIKEIFNLIKKLDDEKRLEMLPPITPLFSKLKDKYRFHLLIKSYKEKDLSGKYMNKILREVKDYTHKNIPKKVMVNIDVDAVNLL